jgi:cytosine/adenosine deaminase-related metal-dependent hydrolase
MERRSRRTPGYGIAWLAVVCLLSVGLAPVSAGYVLIDNGTVIPVAAGLPHSFTGYVLINPAGKIDQVGPGPAVDNPLVQRLITQQAVTRIEASGKLIVPGFISGHSHLWQSAFRGIAPDGELEPWLQALHWTYGKHLQAGDLYAFTLHGALDQLRHGVTTTYNHSHWLKNDYALYLEQYTAELAAGQHFVFAYVLDVKNHPVEQEQAKLQQLIAAAKQLPALSPLLGFSVNARGMYISDEVFAQEVQIARALGLTVQMHYLEAASQSQVERRKFAMISRGGGLFDGMSFAHFIHTTEAIQDTAGAARTSMIWNPLSNGRLASGLPDIHAYMRKGIGIGMGVDGQASADISDPFENMRMGLYALRMREQHAKGLQPHDILRLHTLETAKVLKIDHLVGSLEPGKWADLLMVNPHRPSTGPIFDPLATLVFACSASNIERVLVAGKVTVVDGHLVDHDFPTIEREVQQRITRLRQQVTETR